MDDAFFLPWTHIICFVLCMCRPLVHGDWHVPFLWQLRSIPSPWWWCFKYKKTRLEGCGKWDDKWHPTIITMVLSPSPRDTCITSTKVNSTFYACLLGSLMDDIILDPPSICTYMFEPSDNCAMEEDMHKRELTPSATEAWGAWEETPRHSCGERWWRMATSKWPI